uniref:F-box domain-containing protein n=1 Tax=Aegilops tauschii subsp. strangulata TaxID=200361 RepID=A0A453T9H2_AEGTS
RAWRGLWARRWEDDGNPSPSLHHHLRPHSTPSSNKLLEALELRQFQGRRGRIDRYSLVVDTLAMRARGLDRYLAAAARCGVELRRTCPADTPLLFHFPAGAGPALARLSLRGIGVSGLQGRAARPCAALEAVLLHSVRLDDRDLARMLALCPRLRVLGLCSCTGISRVVVMAVMGLTSLRSVTIVDCTCLIGVDFTVVSSLRSFRYSGGCFFYLPGDALFADIDIRFGVKTSRNVLICQKVY